MLRIWNRSSHRSALPTESCESRYSASLTDDKEPLPPGPRGLGQDGEVAQGEVAVVALSDAVEPVSSFTPLATGIAGGRSAQTALEMAQGGRPVLPLDGDRAQVEEHKRVIGRSASRIMQSRWSF